MKTLVTWIALLRTIAAWGQEVTFVREYTYKASEMDSKYSSRTVATNQLRAILLNELGVYVQSERLLTTVEVGGKFSQDFNETIATVSAGITKLEILEEKWNGEEFWMKASITVDKSSLETSLKELIKDRQKIKELEYTREQLNQAIKNVEQLKQDLTDARSESQRVAISEQYFSEIDDLDEAMSQLAASIFWKRQFNKADSAIRLNQYPEDLKFLYAERATARLQMKDFQGALEDCNKSISLGAKPRVIDDPFYTRAEAKYYLRNYKEAIPDMDKSIESYPDQNKYLLRSQIKFGILDYEGALTDINKAMSYLKSHDNKSWWAKVYRNRGNLKYALKDYDGAVLDYKKAKEFQPLDAKFFALRGTSKYYSRNSEGALSDFNKAIDMGYTEDATVFFYRGYCNDELGYLVDAILDFDKAESLSPKYDAPIFLRSLTTFKLQSKRAQLYGELYMRGIYSNSYQAFIKQFQSGENLKKLHDYLVSKSLTTETFEVFKSNGFETISEYTSNRDLRQTFDYLTSRTHYTDKVYSVVKSIISDFDLTREEFNMRLQDLNYQKKVYKALKEKIGDFSISEEDFCGAINGSVGLMVTTVLDFQNQMKDSEKIQVLYDYLKDAVCNDLLKSSELGVDEATTKMRVYCK